MSWYERIAVITDEPGRRTWCDLSLADLSELWPTAFVETIEEAQRMGVDRLWVDVATDETIYIMMSGVHRW